MDGMLDMLSEQLVRMPKIVAPIGWCKMTISSFRWEEVADFFSWDGWRVRPLLVVRDVRHAYASLKTKTYGKNGTTAEDPPLRLRMLRFHRDWKQFHERGWPILRYESFVEDPESALRDSCRMLGLSWSDAMLSFPKPLESIADHKWGNPTFLATLSSAGIKATLKPGTAILNRLTRDELAWLEEIFGEYNRLNSYPEHVEVKEFSDHSDVPSYESTTRYAWELEVGQLRSKLLRIQTHPILGRLMRGWQRFVNPNIDIF